MINLTPNIVHKAESQFFDQTSFHDVTANNASSGVRDNVILTNIYFWCQNHGGKIEQKIELKIMNRYMVLPFDVP